MPEIKPGDWIIIGKTGKAAHPTIDAIVSIAKPDFIEAVYLERTNQAVNRDIVWQDDHWEFARPSPDGGHADHSSRLSYYVIQLHRGRHH